MAHSLNKFQDQDIKTEDDVIGKTDHDFYAASRADTYRADDEAVMASGIPMVNRLEPAPEPLGSPRLVTTSKIPLRDKEEDYWSGGLLENSPSFGCRERCRWVGNSRGGVGYHYIASPFITGNRIPA